MAASNLALAALFTLAIRPIGDGYIRPISLSVWLKKVLLVVSDYFTNLMELEPLAHITKNKV